MTNESDTMYFGDISCELKKSSKDPISDGYEFYVGLEHLDSESLTIKRWGSLVDDKPSFTKVFKKGQILFGRRRAYLKKAAIAHFDGVCSGDIIVIDAKDDSDYKRILPYLIQSEKFWRWAVKNSAGGLSPRTKFKNLAEFSFSPKNKEQILSLEKAFKALEVSDSRLHEAREKLDQLQNVLISGLTRTGYKKEAMKTTAIGRIPTSWQAISFGSLLLADTKNGLYKPQEHYGSGPKMVHMGDIFHSLEITDEDIEKSVNVSDKEIANFGLLDEDLLFARRSLVKEGAGLCCIYRGKDNFATFESSIIRARLDKNRANPVYFNYFFRSAYGRWVMERIIQTVAASGITSNDLKKLIIPVPTKCEQDEIARILKQAQETSESLRINHKKKEKVLKNLINKIVE